MTDEKDEVPECPILEDDVDWAAAIDEEDMDFGDE